MENDMGFLRRKWVWIAIGLPILIVAWLAFRPEKLWINQRVNEPAPFASRSEARPIFAGRLEEKPCRSSKCRLPKEPSGCAWD
jgi:hypothetical protein